MGVAEVLVNIKASLRGNVLFVFQPAEEGAPPGEVGGASEMLKAGIFEKYQPEVAFGLHAWASMNTGVIGYRSGPLMADSNVWRIVVKGKQTHGSRPWNGVDPILVASQIVTGLQTIVSRQVDITDQPAVVSVGIIKGGVRNNIIPDSAEMIGTLRTFTPEQKAKIVAGMKLLAEKTAEASGANRRVRARQIFQPGGRQQSRAHREGATQHRTHCRQRERQARTAGDGLRGLRILRAESAQLLLLRGCDAEGPQCRDRAVQSLARVLSRRAGHADRHAHAHCHRD